ncbi:hypothetical protein RTF36_11895 [Mammaliicoccus sciuri]|uniref:hypothetical protein n=1 Tax=Mammaliicoccus sciuri TaxID=1296 RepID=UPI0028FC5B74|nr:hypothetical protein [Mammaliicoccus sciuri]MDU0267909.1 hypothetical protein [Mammaliicoccus sciuri]
MKLFVKIFFAVILGQLVILLLLNILGYSFLKSYEKIETVISIIGLITTFLGAYFGAKIAGNESRNLFKQEIKMNDLSKNMDINLEVLESIEEIKKNIDYMKELNKYNYLDPETTQKLIDKSRKIKDNLNHIKKDKLSSTSVILYSDVHKLYNEFEKVNREINGIINPDETKEILGSIEIQNKCISVISYWNKYSVYDGVILIGVIDSEDKDRLEEISLDLIIKSNLVFFEEKRKKVNNLLSNTYNVYNKMKYKNRIELIEEYTKLYRN